MRKQLVKKNQQLLVSQFLARFPNFFGILASKKTPKGVFFVRPLLRQIIFIPLAIQNILYFK